MFARGGSVAWYFGAVTCRGVRAAVQVGHSWRLVQRERSEPRCLSSGHAGAACRRRPRAGLLNVVRDARSRRLGGSVVNVVNRLGCRCRCRGAVGKYFMGRVCRCVGTGWDSRQTAAGPADRASETRIIKRLANSGCESPYSLGCLDVHRSLERLGLAKGWASAWCKPSAYTRRPKEKHPNTYG